MEIAQRFIVEIRCLLVIQFYRLRESFQRDFVLLILEIGEPQIIHRVRVVFL